MNGKGSNRRKGDDAVKFRENYDMIFKAEGKPMEPFDCDIVGMFKYSPTKKTSWMHDKYKDSFKNNK